ncbi:MAG: TolC family protein [Chitinophagales bacterium]
MKSRFLWMILLLSAATVFAQETLTVEQAIEIALKNNYDIQLSQNRATIAALNNSPGNAGMLPRINGVVSDNATLNNLNQKYSSGLEVNTNNATGNNLAASVNLNWTLFDGLRMFATKGRLKKLEEIGELNYKDTLQNVVAQTIVAYYDVVSAQQQINAINETIKIAEERVKIADLSFNIGSSSKVDLLQAKVDLNAGRSALLNQRKLIEQKKADLNRILARPAETDFNTQDTIPVNYEPKLSDPAELDTKNFQLQAALKNLDVAKYSKKEAFSYFLPNLTGNAAYGFTRTNSSSGFALYNQQYGLSGGFTLSLPLFNGLVNWNNYKVAGVQVQSSQFTLERARLQVKVNYYKAIREFLNAKEILKLEEDNIGLAKENASIALERFRLAQSTALELREAERSYTEALTRLVNARFNAKTAETELMRLQGELVK